MEQNSLKTIEEKILAMLEQGLDKEQIAKTLADQEVTKEILSFISQFENNSKNIPDSRRLFDYLWNKLSVTLPEQNRYIINHVPGNSRNSWINQLTNVFMKTKTIIGASVAGLIITAGIGGYLLINRTANPENQGSLPGTTDMASAPQQDTGLKTSDISLTSSDTLINSIIAMAENEMPGEEIYQDIDLASIDNNIINDIYNTYDQTQL